MKCFNFGKKFISFLVIVSILAGSAPASFGAEGWGSFTVNYRNLPDFYRPLMKVFDEGDLILGPYATVKTSRDKLASLLQSKNPNFYSELFGKAVDYNNIEYVLSALNTSSETGSYGAYAFLGFKTSYAVKAKTVRLGKLLGKIGTSVVLLKIAHEWWNNGSLAEAAWNNAHDLAKIVAASKFAAKLGGRSFYPVVTAILLLHQIGSFAYYDLKSAYDTKTEEVFNQFSKFNITYVPNKNKFSYKLNLKPRGALNKKAIDALSPFERTWEESEFSLNWKNKESWRKLLISLFEKNKDTPDKMEESVQTLLDGYVTFFWELPSKFRIEYIKNYRTLHGETEYMAPTKTEQRNYSEKLKTSTLILLAPFYKEYYEKMMNEAIDSAVEDKRKAEEEFNEMITFNIEVFDQELAASGATYPYISIMDSKYKDYYAVFENPDLPNNKHIFASHQPGRGGAWWTLKGSVRCTYLSYLFYGEPTVLKLYKKLDDKKPEVTANFSFGAPTTTIRIGGELTNFSGKYRCIFTGKDGSDDAILTIVDDGEKFKIWNEGKMVFSTGVFNRKTNVFTASEERAEVKWNPTALSRAITEAVPGLTPVIKGGTAPTTPKPKPDESKDVLQTLFPACTEKTTLKFTISPDGEITAQGQLVRTDLSGKEKGIARITKINMTKISD